MLAVVKAHLAFLGSVKATSKSEADFVAIRAQHKDQINKSLRSMSSKSYDLSDAAAALDAIGTSIFSDDEKSVLTSNITMLMSGESASDGTSGSREILKQQEHMYFHKYIDQRRVG